MSRKSQKAASKPPALDVRGMLIHVTHIDPEWLKHKDVEKPWDLQVGLDIVKALAEYKMNTLIVDVEDGVEYKSHPEIKRHYSVPIQQLAELSDAARKADISVVPKLNFSKSGRNLHDMWMKPHWDHVSWLRNIDEYYKVASDVIAELVEVMQPDKYFHIGMDEDHYRSVEQYVDTIHKLREFVSRHGLRTVVWNDSCHNVKTKIAHVHAVKCREAEAYLNKDIIHILWDYGASHPDVVKRISGEGFTVWGAPGANVDQVRAWKASLLDNGGSGMIITNWIKCSEDNRATTMNLIRTVGGEY